MTEPEAQTLVMIADSMQRLADQIDTRDTMLEEEHGHEDPSHALRVKLLARGLRNLAYGRSTGSLMFDVDGILDVSPERSGANGEEESGEEDGPGNG